MPAFPNNVTDTLAFQFRRVQGLTMIDDGSTQGKPAIFKRLLRPSDPASSLGVFALDWVPDDYEISNVGPTLSTYTFAVQVLVRHGDEQVGMQTHAALSKNVRAMLYRDTPLRVALQQLNETSYGTLERAQRWGVREQRFANNEMDGQFVYLSTTDFWLQTESV